ncbi:interferon beta-like [Chelydra serpentina]|uniref:Interferon beta-like n=1 Tax=Chelydra serpentina TaxID=8475 RepID=A0A8T1SQS0_CHESE|nr:interferon beta-like [Chelydra serpentina]
MLHFQQNKVNQASLQLLEKMGEQFPVQCLNENSNFISLQNVLSSREFQKENAMVAILEILQQIFNIFSKSQLQTAWDRSSIVAFQNGLHQQKKKMETTYPQNEDLTRLKVKKYFRVIDNFLKEKQYSLCAYEIIREEMRRCFLFIDQLTKRLKN